MKKIIILLVTLFSVIEISGQATTNFKRINRIQIPTYDYKIVLDKKIPELDLQFLMMEKGDNMIGVTVDANNNITSLEKYSSYMTEKNIRNVGKNGLILKSIHKNKEFFKGYNSIVETFVDNEQTIQMKALNFKIDDYFYSLFYVLNTEAEMIINAIEIQTE